MDSELQDLVGKLGVADRVQFAGQRDNVEMFLAASDCFVLSSDSEGLPCSVLEAMASGLPVIASDVGGIGELVTNDRNGFLFKKGDIAELTSHMDKVSRDPSLCVECGTRAREMAETKYSIDTMLQSYITVYEELMTVSNRSPGARLRRWVSGLGLNR